MGEQGAGSREQGGQPTPRRVRSYRDLVVWRRGIDLVETIYRCTAQFPREELYGLSAQLRRAAVSVPANIAEGYGRGTRKSYASFVRISRGSLREVETHVIIADRLGFIAEADAELLLQACDELGRILHALITRLDDQP